MRMPLMLSAFLAFDHPFCERRRVVEDCGVAGSVVCSIKPEHPSASAERLRPSPVRRTRPLTGSADSLSRLQISSPNKPVAPNNESVHSAPPESKDAPGAPSAPVAVPARAVASAGTVG
jgi:hypothetical protein